MTMRRLFPDLRHLHSSVIPRMTRLPSPIPRVGTESRARVPTDFPLSIGARARQKSLGIAVQGASGRGDGGTNGQRSRAEANDRR
jgi:hypothetical protein